VAVAEEVAEEAAVEVAVAAAVAAAVEVSLYSMPPAYVPLVSAGDRQ
jgi:flagellar biosynthesis/type III secretory pathway M-ring protein FliF/YscJ